MTQTTIKNNWFFIIVVVQVVLTLVLAMANVFF